MKKIDTMSATKASKATSKKTGKAASKATFKDIGGGCEAVTLTGELAELAAKVAKRAGVSPEEALRLALRSFLEAQEGGKRALFVKQSVFNDLQRMADALNKQSWTPEGERNNTPQTVFESFLFVWNSAAEEFDGIVDGIDLLTDQDFDDVHKNPDGSWRTSANPKYAALEAERRDELAAIASGIEWENT